MPLELLACRKCTPGGALSFQFLPSNFHPNWPRKLPGNSLLKIPKTLHGLHGKPGCSLSPETTTEKDMEGLGVPKQTVQYNKVWRSSFAELHLQLAPNHAIKENVNVEWSFSFTQ